MSVDPPSFHTCVNPRTDTGPCDGGREQDVHARHGRSAVPVRVWAATHAAVTAGRVEKNSVRDGWWHVYDDGMATVNAHDEITQALADLRDSMSHRAEISCLGPEIERAVAAGASWDQVVTAIGREQDEAWEQLRHDVRSAILRNASSSDALPEAQAMELAVAETKAVRKEHARERSRRSRRSGSSH